MMTLSGYLIIASAALLIFATIAVTTVRHRSRRGRVMRDDLDRMWTLYRAAPAGSRTQQQMSELIQHAEADRIRQERNHPF